MAARRHQVENLVLRGTVFYWRPRIPVGFAAVGNSARLSLSLRLSDRKKASLMARRLNALLHEIEVRPAARMSTKEQLSKIFALEIEAMHDEIEGLDRAAKHVGTSRDPLHREAERQVGWAYRLLQAYGTGEKLSFEPGGEGRRALLEAEVDPDDIPFIAATYVAERDGARRGPFLADVLRRMAQVGLDDTTLNRDAAMEQIHKARAEALLGSAARSRAIRLGEPQEEPVRPPRVEAAEVPIAKPSLLWEADLPLPASTGKKGATESETGRTTSGQTQNERLDELQTDVVAAAPIPPPSNTRGQPKNLPLSEFDAQLDKLIANHQDDWEPDTASDVRVLVGIFKGILEEHDVTHSGEITQEHVAALRQHFNHILPNYGRSPHLRAMSPKELREESKRRAEEAQKNDQAVIRLGLRPATIRRHLGNLDHFLKHLRSSHFAVPTWTFEGLRPKKPAKGDVRLQQVKPGPADVRPIFDLPIFTGRLNDEQPELPGNLTVHCGLYFLPMLYTYLGPRRNEFAGLGPDDIVLKEGTWAIQIRANKLRRIKNAQSHRLLPVPEELLRLNFIDYVERIKALGHTQLFPELFSPYLEKNDPGDRFYKEFVPIAQQSPLLEKGLWRRPIHALRHGFADTLKNAGVSEGVIEDLSGRLGTTETATRYTNPSGLSLLRVIISRYPAITEHLEAKPIRLLPWVEKKLPPPWAGKSNGDRFGNKRGRRPRKDMPATSGQSTGK